MMDIKFYQERLAVSEEMHQLSTSKDGLDYWAGSIDFWQEQLNYAEIMRAAEDSDEV